MIQNNNTKNGNGNENENVVATVINPSLQRPSQTDSSKNALPPRKSSNSRQNSRSNSPNPNPTTHASPLAEPHVATTTTSSNMNITSLPSSLKENNSNNSNSTTNQHHAPKLPNQTHTTSSNKNNKPPTLSSDSLSQQQQNQNNNNSQHNFQDPYQSSDMQLYDKPTTPRITTSPTHSVTSNNNNPNNNRHGCVNPPGRRVLTKTRECQTEEDIIGDLEKQVRELKREIVELKKKESKSTTALLEQSQLQQLQLQQQNQQQKPSVYIVSSQEIAQELTRLLAKDPKSIERRRESQNNNNNNSTIDTSSVTASGSFVHLGTTSSPLQHTASQSTRRLQALASSYEELSSPTMKNGRAVEAIETRDKIYVKTDTGIDRNDISNNFAQDEIESRINEFQRREDLNRSLENYQSTYDMLPVAVAAAKDRTVIRPIQSKRFGTLSSSPSSSLLYSQRTSYVAEKEALLVKEDALTSRVHQFPPNNGNNNNSYHHQQQHPPIALSTILQQQNNRSVVAAEGGDENNSNNNISSIIVPQTSHLIDSRYYTDQLSNSEIRSRNLQLHEQEAARQMDKIRGRPAGEEDYRYHSYVPTDVSNRQRNFGADEESPFFQQGNMNENTKRHAKDPMHSVVALEEL